MSIGRKRGKDKLRNIGREGHKIEERERDKKRGRKKTGDEARITQSWRLR